MEKRTGTWKGRFWILCFLTDSPQRLRPSWWTPPPDSGSSSDDSGTPGFESGSGGVGMRSWPEGASPGAGSWTSGWTPLPPGRRCSSPAAEADPEGISRIRDPRVDCVWVAGHIPAGRSQQGGKDTSQSRAGGHPPGEGSRYSPGGGTARACGHTWTGDRSALLDWPLDHNPRNHRWRACRGSWYAAPGRSSAGLPWPPCRTPPRGRGRSGSPGAGRTRSRKYVRMGTSPGCPIPGGTGHTYDHWSSHTGTLPRQNPSRVLDSHPKSITIHMKTIHTKRQVKWIRQLVVVAQWIKQFNSEYVKIFCHLKLEIASAIPASKEKQRIKQFNTEGVYL